MKLVDKLTLWLVGIVFLVTPISMVISYRSIRDNIRSAEITRLQDVNNKVAEQLKAGIPPHKYFLDRPIAIKQISAMPAQNTQASTYPFYNTELKRDECRLDVVSYYKINNLIYSVSTYNYVARGQLILQGMMRALVWKMILIIVFVAISGRLISRYVLSSFQKTLGIMQAFSLRQKEKIALPVTNTTEFKQLNFFLKKMTDIALEDYSRVKEFSENASHEVQTPLAVIRSKLELLSETNIGENQAVLIDDMQNAVEKLVKINRSLLLLTKLDNFEFEASENIRFCKITKEALASFENWIQMKNLYVTTNIDNNVSLQIHSVLAEILVTNLISNAIRYNIENGKIDVTLTSNSLTVKNTGLPPEIEPELLFRRFKKSNQSADSIGLGLSIVKQICTVNNFKVSYNFENGLHILQVNFAEAREIIEEPEENRELIFNKNTALA
jgi:two-component system sensor histidine kinase QseC